jgi:hypothetical protein
MSRRSPEKHRPVRGGGAGRRARAASGARRVWPFVLMAWKRWQALSPDDQERYKRRARDYANRGRRMVDERRRRRSR